MGRDQTQAPAPEAPVRDHDAELRLGCLKAALELRTSTTSSMDALAMAERFYAWTKKAPQIS